MLSIKNPLLGFGFDLVKPLFLELLSSEDEEKEVGIILGASLVTGSLAFLFLYNPTASFLSNIFVSDIFTNLPNIIASTTSTISTVSSNTFAILPNIFAIFVSAISSASSNIFTSLPNILTSIVSTVSTVLEVIIGLIVLTIEYAISAVFQFWKQFTS